MRLQAFLALMLAASPVLADAVSVPGVPRAIGLTGKQGAAVKYAPGPGAPTYIGPGDVVTGAKFWGGLRAYNSAAVGGKSVNLRRASDNAQCDFDIAATGALGNSDAGCSLGGGLTLAAFATQDATASCTIAGTTATCTGASSQPHAGSTIVGTGVTQPCWVVSTTIAGGGGSGNITVTGGPNVSATAPCGVIGSSTPLTLTYGLFVSQMYDQSGALACTGAACNVVQATATKQPQLLPTCLGALPCLGGTGGSIQFLAGATYSPVVGIASTISVVTERNGSVAQQRNIYAATNTNVAGYFTASANTTGMSCGVSATATAADNAFHALQFVVSTTATVINVDGVSGTPAGACTNTQSTPQVMAGASASSLQGYLSEVGVWGSSFTAPQLTSMCHNQFTYWGTPTSC